LIKIIDYIIRTYPIGVSYTAALIYTKHWGRWAATGAQPQQKCRRFWCILRLFWR